MELPGAHSAGIESLSAFCKQSEFRSHLPLSIFSYDPTLGHVVKARAVEDSHKLGNFKRNAADMVRLAPSLLLPVEPASVTNAAIELHLSARSGPAPFESASLRAGVACC